MWSSVVDTLQRTNRSVNEEAPKMSTTQRLHFSTSSPAGLVRAAACWFVSNTTSCLSFVGEGANAFATTKSRFAVWSDQLNWSLTRKQGG